MISVSPTFYDIMLMDDSSFSTDLWRDVLLFFTDASLELLLAGQFRCSSFSFKILQMMDSIQRTYRSHFLFSTSFYFDVFCLMPSFLELGVLYSFSIWFWVFCSLLFCLHGWHYWSHMWSSRSGPHRRCCTPHLFWFHMTKEWAASIHQASSCHN